MRDLSGTTAATERLKTAVRVVWLVEIDADVPGGGSETLRYASRAYTLDGNAYADGLLENGIRLGWARLRARGGLASVSGFTLEYSNAEQLADSMDDYVLDNDAVRVYAVFCTGAEDADDRIQLAAGVIEDTSFNRLRLTMRCIDSSDQDFREVPAQKVNLAQHPYAPLSEFGRPLPLAFGFSIYDPVSIPYAPTAQCVCLDAFSEVYSFDTWGRYGTVLYLFNESVRAWMAASAVAVDANYADTAVAADTIGLRLSGAERTLYLMCSIPGSGNTSSEWVTIASRALSGTAGTIRSGEVLELSPPGCGALGKISECVVEVDVYLIAYCRVTIEYDGTQLLSTYISGDFTSPDLKGYMRETWDLGLFTVRIDNSPYSMIRYVRLKVTYDANDGSNADQPQRAYHTLDGYRTHPDRQNYTIPGTHYSAAITPAEVLAAVLTRKDAYSIPSSAINAASFVAAHAARDNSRYTLQFQVRDTVTWEYWNRLCFEMALHVYKDNRGQWKVLARDKEATAQHFFPPGRIALKEPRNPSSTPDVSLERTPTRDVINEVVLRYCYDPATDSYRKMMVRSPQARYTGTCTVDAAAGTLTDAAASFASGDFPAFVGDRIYVLGVGTLEVTAVNSDTELAVEAWDQDDSILTDVTAATDYYGGASISGRMVRSWLRYKTINPLGGEFDPVKRSGGWASDFIADDDVAAAFLNYVEDWFTERRIVVELATGLEAIDVELGDVCYLRCPILPSHRDAVALGALDGAITDSDTTLTCSTTGYLGSGAFRDGDFMAIGGEVVQVDGEPDAGDEDLTIVRAQCNTQAAAHASGATVYLLQDKWEVTGVKCDIAKAQIRLEFVEMPRAAYRVGAAMASDDDYDSAVWEERVAGSWAHPDSGLLAETDPHSDYSHARD